MAIEPKTQADREKLKESLSALTEEDPTFKVSINPDTGQTLISGMGELHLEIIRDRLLREFRVQANAGKPVVAYREGITATGRGENTFQREITGKMQFGHVVIEVSPLPRSAGSTVKFDVDETQIPAEFHAAMEDGIQDGLITGVLGNYPMIDVSVRVVGGAFRPLESTEIAFRTAAIMALRAAAEAAHPVLLEPIMKLEITTPEEHLGDVIGDLNGRRGRIKEMEPQDAVQIVRADVPLAELFGYATALRSLSRGRASYSMEPVAFEIVPEALQSQVLSR
jgi:elongation factor G